MITPKEIRIGNWVRHPNSEWYDKITIEDFNLENMDYFQPIPLTEEWLLKFGFKRIEQDDKGNEYCNILYSITHNGNLGSIDLDLWMFDGWQFISSSCFIKHVHQLQNLYFALTGEELKINP